MGLGVSPRSGGVTLHRHRLQPLLVAVAATAPPQAACPPDDRRTMPKVLGFPCTPLPIPLHIPHKRGVTSEGTYLNGMDPPCHPPDLPLGTKICW